MPQSFFYLPVNFTIRAMVKNLMSLFFLFIPLLLAAQLPSFKDVTTGAGIDFRYTFGDYTYENILESSGSGIAILDFDNDGNMDVYLLNGTYLEGISDPAGKEFANTTNKLYRNNGNGTFAEVSANAGVDDRHWSMAATAIDYDGDGFTDIFLSNYGPNVFYRNNGDGTFSDIAGKVGLTGPEKINGFTKWSVGAAFWDYNMDGLLDVMVGNFLAFDPTYISTAGKDMMPHPAEYRGQASLLYQQEKDGSFIEVTKENGFHYSESKCMGLTVFDYDDDGDLDLFQGNDHQFNFLFRNDKTSYKEVAVASGIAVNNDGQPTGSMHGTIGDVNGDGLIDLLVTDLKYGAMYRNLGNGLFDDVTIPSGIAGEFKGKGQWGAALFDFDNDGDLDLFSANGTAEELVLQLPILLENDGTGKFSNIGKTRGEYFNTKRSGRGAAVWDFDNDGDLDIIVSHVDLMATPVFLRNDGGNSNNWLGLTLLGINGQALAIGAKVTLSSGGLQQVKINQWVTSYLSSNDPRMHFGLGKQNIVEKLEIRWPDGKIEEFENLEVNQYLTIVEGEGVKTY